MKLMFLHANSFYTQSCASMEQKELLEELAESVGAMATWSSCCFRSLPRSTSDCKCTYSLRCLVGIWYIHGCVAIPIYPFLKCYIFIHIVIRMWGICLQPSIKNVVWISSIWVFIEFAIGILAKYDLFHCMNWSLCVCLGDWSLCIYVLLLKLMSSFELRWKGKITLKKKERKDVHIFKHLLCGFCCRQKSVDSKKTVKFHYHWLYYIIHMKWAKIHKCENKCKVIEFS